MIEPVLPGATIGVLGSGQLGRMFTIAARRMGYYVNTFSPEDHTPTGQVADLEIRGSYDDLDAVREFARGVAVMTFEFENVPAPTAAAAAEGAPVRPAGTVLHTTQNRLREKTFLAEGGFPLPKFAAIRTAEDLEKGLAVVGRPAVLKTASWGYDGKGQVLILPETDAKEAWATIGGGDAVLEQFVDFECEVSVVAARGDDGSFAHYGVIRNEHHQHILDISTWPGVVSPAIEKEAVEVARGILDSLGVVGVLCVEFFLTKEGKLLVNELAPRPHNSGHLTFDACVTSQFEQQLRAICGLPLGSTDFYRAAAMANLLGDLWQRGEPNWQAVTAFPNVKLHLYGKSEARPGRKMGHLTCLDDTPERARFQVLAAREALLS
ncbi:N5-carboxyaminoimidazole ribonucleotide synthase [Planctomycetes bacterium Pan216]|uniref:N5-carboxyaminoimidazole ribonucleotide synthase n=1 Tax=Kolteria novifilia TaxID=2527975 RepID=A0A518AZP9_9BACT|nr:N5-carboxyaminoimidazole ribonucleotide synthase [Planctomycetes bacterium Pan216]